MRRTTLSGWDAKRLRLVLGLLFLALAIPSALLIDQAFGHLKWAAFRQHQLLAEELAARIDAGLHQLLREEATRPIADYQFLVAGGTPPTTFLQRSPLSQLPVPSALPGLVGYFQVDDHGALSTPLLPAAPSQATDYGVTADELAQRTAVQDRVREILTENRLVRAGRAETAASVAPRADTDLGVQAELADAPAPAGTEAKAAPSLPFDRLKEFSSVRRAKKSQEGRQALGRVEDLQLDERFQQSAPAAGAPPREPVQASRIEQLAPQERESDTPAARSATAEIRIFDSEVEPLQLALLDSGHFVLFRQVWQDRGRYVQGALLEQQPLLREVIETAFRDTVLSRTTDLVVAWHGDVLSALSGQVRRGYPTTAGELRGALLLRTRLSAPADAMELVFSVAELPAGPGAGLLGWLAAALGAVLIGGFYLLYRLGLRQIALARQQQDFVSAVSHELKTPLTSIRMYGELLREGWAPEAKRQAYYAYIHDESERLSRLIDNVLQLARMTRNDLRLSPRAVTAGELVDVVRSKVASQAERAGFTLDVDCAGEAAETVVSLDTDAFSQILINLVDNAIKFSTRAGRKAVEIRCRPGDRNTVCFSVRDFGPGVPKDQLRKIFRLFYRAESGQSGGAVGTGIGLALVRQLAEAMGGTVDIVNRDPGAEFTVSFPAAR